VVFVRREVEGGVGGISGGPIGEGGGAKVSLLLGLFLFWDLRVPRWRYEGRGCWVWEYTDEHV